MALRPRNGRWEYRFMLNGERISRLTDWAATEENRTKAEKAEKARRDAILKGLEPARQRAPRGFTKASIEFMDTVRLEHKDKPNTVHRVETSLASLRVWFGDRHVSAIRTSDVERYKVWRLTGDEEAEIAPVQPITVRHDLDALSKFFRWARKMDLCAGNPVSDVDKPSSDDAVRMHIITPAEEMDYFARCEEARYRNLADVARLIREQGMRPEEAMTLERRGVDLRLGRVTIFKGKTKAARRTLKLTAAALEIVNRRHEMSDSRWLFPSPKRAGRPLCKLNGPHDKVCASREPKDEKPGRHALTFVLYDFRHTFATEAAQRGMPLTTLAAILGHSSLRMVTKYVHPTQEHMDAEMVRMDSESALGEVDRTQFGPTAGPKWTQKGHAPANLDNSRKRLN